MEDDGEDGDDSGWGATPKSKKVKPEGGKGVDPTERTIVKVVRKVCWTCNVCGRKDNKPDSQVCEGCASERGITSEPSDIPVFVTPSQPIHADGTYLASFFPPKPGRYQITVLHGGIHIKESPMIVLVENGKCK